MERRPAKPAQPAERKLNLAAALFGPEANARPSSALQPGLLTAFRIFVVVTALTPALMWRILEWQLGIPRPTLKSAQSPAIFTIFLLLYTSWPWLRRKMGRAFFPVALVVKAVQPVVGSYLTMIGFVPPAYWEYFTVVSMLRLAILFQFILILVAWQYDLIWPILAGIVFSALNAAFGFFFLKPGSTFFPLYLTCITAQVCMAVGTGVAMGLIMRIQRRQTAALDDRNRKLAQYASIVEQLAITQERNRLARELHDTLAHSLSAVAIQIEAAQALLETGAAAGQRMLEQALQTTRKGLTEARRSVHGLRASPLEDLGLALAVRNLAESMAARTGLKVDLQIGSHLEDLAPEVEQCLYRVAQEALTNVARHANAVSVQVALARENGHVRLSIHDDGRGFDVSAVGDMRYGLKGLRERAETIGGTLVVESEQERGTTVALEVKGDR